MVIIAVKSRGLSLQDCQLELSKTSRNLKELLQPRRKKQRVVLCRMNNVLGVESDSMPTVFCSALVNVT